MTSIPCGQPAVLKHGSCRIIGRTVYYTCNCGFSIIGKARSICMLNGRWQFPAPYCVAVYIGPRGPKGTQGPDGMHGAKGDNGQPGQPGQRGHNGIPGTSADQSCTRHP
ncbi:collagen alpha-1(XXV) chain-like [Pristis pectinata]|uniref:collagen alpha-1(XXV) chain-like n=1 Tax=Pristis pectinata TaxID=685728 RepID=UPI00223E5D92|nr:collagen alpha-1(XXV) chain-like [Pristis pectinata]